MDLSTPEFAQFLVLKKDELFPRRPIVDPSDFLNFPISASENPRETASHVPGGQGPTAFLLPVSANRLTVEAIGVGFWQDLSLPDLARNNRDLDADRSVQDLCWTTLPGTTLSQDPVVVRPLPY
jgi:hypothetical protein